MFEQDHRDTLSGSFCLDSSICNTGAMFHVPGHPHPGVVCGMVFWQVTTA